MKLGVIVSILCLSAPALADVAPPLARGMEFLVHRVVVENMAEHPKWSLVVYDRPSSGKIRAHLVFNADTKKEQHLVSGRSWREKARFRSPRVWLVPRETAQAWSKVTKAEIMRQRAACQRGEGCAHISRFQPKYAAPDAAVDCGVAIKVTSKRKVDRSGKPIVLHTYRLTKASATACMLETKQQASIDLPKPGPLRWPWLVVIAAAGVGGAFLMRRRSTAPVQEDKER